MNGAIISASSRVQDSATLSLSKSKLVAGVETAQKMLFAMRVLEDMGLKVKKPMLLEMDCQRALVLAHKWSSSGRMRHIDVKYHFLRELKELGLIIPVWIATDKNTSDMFTKNLPGPLYDKFLPTYCTNELVSSETSSQVDCNITQNVNSKQTATPTEQRPSIFEDPTNSHQHSNHDLDPKKNANDDPSHQPEAANSATCVEPKEESETALVVWEPNTANVAE